MNEITNKQIVQKIFSALAKGNSKPFLTTLAENFTWIIPGTTAWSGKYIGKKAVQETLLAPLFAQFATQYTNCAQRILADGDHVVVECKGNVTTKSGAPYNNTYCWICTLQDGKLIELTEYLDTELLSRVLEAPQPR
ncbi:MAG: nuclear transport factor 2 family protein [Spirochaetia bacterium]|nr:nuclear transport factor 2 family protein [Spirochaetia bacterium]